MLEKMKYRPGVIKDDTEYSSNGYAVDSDKIRFVRGRVESLGGYQDATGGQRLAGICRGLHSWVDNVGYKYMAGGTTTKLYVERDGVVYDITPIRGTGTGSITSVGTAATVTSAAHGMSNGDTVYLSSTGITPSGALPADPVYTGEGTSIVTVNVPSHGVTEGDLVTLAGLTTFNGIDPNGTWSADVPDPDTLVIDVGVAATASGFGGGGAGTYVTFQQFVITYIDANTFSITLRTPVTAGPQACDLKFELSIGNVDGTSPGGYSTGPYSVGPYGASADPQSRSEFLPRTWALDNIGQFLVASPLGGGVYIWELGLSSRAVLVPNAPLQNDYMIVTAEGAIMVFGTINTDGNYDPLVIRNSDIRTGAGTPYETWTPAPANSADETRLNVGSTIIGARKTKVGIATWTDNALHFGTYVGSSTQTYRFDHIATGCGLGGPNAAVEKDGTVYWYTPDVGFYQYTSGSPTVMNCPVRQFVVDAIPSLQNFKVYAAYDAVFNGVYWLYPGESTEVDRYVRVDLTQMVDENSGWSVGTTNMSAWLDRNPLTYPRSVRIDGMIADQERGLSADGAPMERVIEYAPMEIGDYGTRVLNINKVVFDAVCQGDIDLTVRYRRYPNGPVVEKGPFPQLQTTEYTSARGQGRQAGFLWRSYGIDDKWRFGDVRFDVSGGGQR